MNKNPVALNVAMISVFVCVITVSSYTVPVLNALRACTVHNIYVKEEEIIKRRPSDVDACSLEFFPF